MTAGSGLLRARRFGTLVTHVWPFQVARSKLLICRELPGAIFSPRPIAPLTYQSTVVLASALNFNGQPNPCDLPVVGKIEEFAVR